MAYGLLMWLREQARNNRGLLDAKIVETISTFTTSEDWMRRHLCDPWLIHRGLEEETIGHDLSLWTTNAQVIQRFLDVSTGFEQESQNVWRVDVVTK